KTTSRRAGPHDRSARQFLSRGRVREEGFPSSTLRIPEEGKEGIPSRPRPPSAKLSQQTHNNEAGGVDGVYHGLLGPSSEDIHDMKNSLRILAPVARIFL